MVRVERARIITDERWDEQIIFLREASGAREFPIAAGLLEAYAIDRTVKENFTECPQAHHLVASVISLLEAEVEKVILEGLDDGVCSAKLVMASGSVRAFVDCRPPDAIRVALKAEAASYVADHVMNTVFASRARIYTIFQPQRARLLQEFDASPCLSDGASSILVAASEA